MIGKGFAFSSMSIQPDIVQGGREQIQELAGKGLVRGKPVDFIENRLAIMVKEGNPSGVRSLADLGRPGVRVANPNPETEGIAKKIARPLCGSCRARWMPAWCG